MRHNKAKTRMKHHAIKQNETENANDESRLSNNVEGEQKES